MGRSDIFFLNEIKPLLFRTASEMDCSGKKKPDILRIATIPGNTQILKLSGNGLNSDEDLVDILKLKVRKVK